MKELRLAAALAVTGLLLAACSATPTTQPSATPAPKPTATPPPTETAYTPVFEAAACSFQAPEAITVECGYVVVPEDRKGNPADTIQIAVAVYRSTSGAPAPDPVIYLQGGPGGGAVTWITGFHNSFIAPILKERDLIVFDQRGAGLSEPALDCPEVSAIDHETLTRNLSNVERGIRYATALLGCRDRLTVEGANLAAYTSAASAADVHDILTALGYTQANLYGASYGTRLALTIMRDFPEAVRSAVLDSALPLEVKLYNEGAAKIDQTLSALFAACAAEPACDAAYPDLETVFFDLVEQFRAKPVEIEMPALANDQPITATIGGNGLINAVTWVLHVGDLIPVVPQGVYDVRDGDYAFLSYARGLPATGDDSDSVGLKASIHCHEQIFATTPDELEADLAAYPRTEAYGRAAIYGNAATAFGICKTWGAAPFDPRESEPLISDIPTLILTGEFDPTTPPAFGRRLTDNLSHSYFFEFPGQGHAPSIRATENCPLNIALTFLSDPTREPDSACIAEMSGPRFVVPFKPGDEIEFKPVTYADMGISGIVPSAWQDVGLGYFNRAASPLDFTQLGVQGSATTTDEWLRWLTDIYQQTGLDEAPEFVGERSANDLIWRLYTSRYKNKSVDLALAEHGQRALLVILMSHTREHAALYEAVFLPAVDVLKPIE